MAIPEIIPSDPATTYATLNQAIRSINQLLVRIEEATTAPETVRQDLTSKINALRADLTGRLDSISRDFDGIQASLDDLAKVANLRALIALRDGGRPGYAPLAFSRSPVGPAASSDPLDPAGVLQSILGLAYRISGPTVIAPRVPIVFDPDAIMVLRARYWRAEDVTDPNNNAVDVGVQWLDAYDGDAGTTLLHRERNLRVQDGARSFEFRIPSEFETKPEILAPKGAVSWRPYLRVYGTTGSTALAVLDVTEATFSGAYVPDVAALAADLRTLQGQIAAGLPIATGTTRNYRVQDLPDPGNPGRKAYAIDGRAPNAAGVLEPANAGTGVDVTDNGVNWVIVGTNQKVQV